MSLAAISLRKGIFISVNSERYKKRMRVSSGKRCVLRRLLSKFVLVP